MILLICSFLRPSDVLVALAHFLQRQSGRRRLPETGDFENGAGLLSEGVVELESEWILREVVEGVDLCFEAVVLRVYLFNEALGLLLLGYGLCGQVLDSSEVGL